MKLLLLLIPYLSYSLVIPDKMSARILKVYEKNYLVISRGKEDGIHINEHIKITNKEGYVGRAICVKPRMQISHCKVYRVVNPELFSMDTSYIISSILQSEMPDDLKSISEVDFKDRFNDFTDEDLKRPIELQQKRIANFDLPNDIDINHYYPRQDLPVSAISQTNEQWPTNAPWTNQIDVQVSPFNLQTRSNSISTHLAAKLIRQNDDNIFEAEADIQKFKDTDPYRKIEINRERRYAQASYLRKLSTQLSTKSSLRYVSDQVNDLSTPFSGLSFIPIGLRYSPNQIIDFSLYALYESLSFSSQIAQKDVNESYFRYGASVSTQTKAFSHSTFMSSIRVEPELSFTEIQYQIDLSLATQITQGVSFSYGLNYSYNSLYERHYNVDSANLIGHVDLAFKTDF